MNIEPLLNPFILIPTSIIVILDFMFLPLYLKWIKLGDFRRVGWLLVVKPLSTMVCIYFMFTQFGAGFFLGAFYVVVAPIIAVIMFFVLVVQGIRLRKELGFPKASYILNLLGGLVIVISLAIPSMLYSPIKDGCADANSTKVMVMSRAIDAYFAENGELPKTLDELVPDFLTHIPSPTCDLLSGFGNPFVLNTCNPASPYIHTRTLDGMGFEYYSLEDGLRWRRHSFLDGGPGDCP